MTRILESLEVVDHDGLSVNRCTRCAHLLGPASEDFKQQAGTFDEPISAGQPRSRAVESDAWVLRHFVCPGCGVLFEVDMLPRAEPSPRSVQLG
jgi:acetone carboxylase gamma subunit